MKQMFDTSEKLIAEQSDEINGVNTINWCDSSCKHLSLIGDEEVISLSHTKVHVFSDSVLCFGNMSKQPKEFTGWIIFMSMFNDISWGSKDNEQECDSSAKLVSICARRFSPERWSFLGLGSEKKWYSIHGSKPQGEWERVAELMMIKFAECGRPVFRATSPLSKGTLKSKGGGKISMRFCADEGTIETVFRTIIFVNQLSMYGAVSDLCEEYSICQTSTGRLVVAEQSDPLFAPADLLIMTPTSSIEILTQENQLQKHKERVENLSQPDQLIKSLY